MAKYKIKLSEPTRLFPAYGELKDGDVIESETVPSDGVTWSWVETTAKSADPVAADPVVPDSAQQPVINPPQVPATPDQPVS